MRRSRSGAVVLALAGVLCAAGAQSAQCPYFEPGRKDVYWGDLHVHTGYSLDAWGFGTVKTPADAYAFALGEALRLPSGEAAKLDRPLDFMAVTDHAEWFGLMYRCADPLWQDDPYCATLVERSAPATGTEVFARYVVPTITGPEPELPGICADDPEACATAGQHQWRRIQHQANAADDPCRFTAFIGFEWSATPDFSHTHRNVIFASDRVTEQAIDYLRHPQPRLLWEALDRQCRAADGCRAIAIPHNTNMGDGRSFDVETEAPGVLRARARYERLIEIYQEKGSSECLPAFGHSDEDCGFELRLTKRSRAARPDDFDRDEWARMRGSYVRRLLLRGLYAYEQSGERRLNPLQLGIIGSTDNHAATGGFVDEAQWPGSVFGAGNFERTMSRMDWSPGGLVAVWAEENTRSSLFDALHRREVYATSGPRMRVRFAAAPGALDCAEALPGTAVPMGGTVASAEAPPSFLVEALYDRTPLQQIEIVKGDYRGGELRVEERPGQAVEELEEEFQVLPAGVKDLDRLLVVEERQERRQLQSRREAVDRDGLFRPGDLQQAELRIVGLLPQEFRVERDVGRAALPLAEGRELFCIRDQGHRRSS